MRVDLMKQSPARALKQLSASDKERLQGLSARLGEVYERERRRLARDLHDEIGHDLIVLRLHLEMLALDLRNGKAGQLQRKLKEGVGLVKHALSSVRRLTLNLGPTVWSEQGFLPAVRIYARQFARMTAIQVRLRAARLRAKLPSSCETALYRVIQGALSNVAAHSGARHVSITLTSDSGSVWMRIEDDGKGFDVKRKLGAAEKAFGLGAMRERIELLGGEIHFSSREARRAAGGGTTIEVRLPL